MSAPRRQAAWIDVDGGRLFLERSGEGPPLFLVHGWALDHRMFRPQLEALERDFQLITFDRRGFGRSTAPPDTRRETADLLRVLDTLGLERVHLLGMSQGGRIALRFAAEHPDRLRSLLLQGAVIDGFQVDEPEEERLPVTEYAELAKAGELDAVRARWKAHPMMALGEVPEETRRLVDAMLADYEGRDLVAFESAHYGYDGRLRERLATFPHPVLILTGARETNTRKAHANALLNTFPDAREVLLPRAGHLSNLEEPDAYNEAVRSFCLEIAA